MKRVLFIDDNLFILRSIKRLFKGSGIEACTTESTIEAVTQIHQTPEMFDLIVTDWDCDNFLKRNGENAMVVRGEDVVESAILEKVPVVVHSGNAQLELKYEGVELWHKPSADLLDRVRSKLGA